MEVRSHGRCTAQAARRPVNEIHITFLHSFCGFETRFGWDRWDPQHLSVQGSNGKTHLKSGFWRHFDKGAQLALRVYQVAEVACYTGRPDRGADLFALDDLVEGRVLVVHPRVRARGISAEPFPDKAVICSAGIEFKRKENKQNVSPQSF